MRATGFGAVLFVALSGCAQTQTTGYNASASSGGQGSTAATSGGTSGGQTTGGPNPCALNPPCPAGLVCDPNKNGACECYLGGPACGPTQICDADGGCINDPCFGVICTAPGAQCYGGICRCGGPAGVECSAPDQSCSPIDNSCGPTASCVANPCAPPTVCNLDDGECHCGTADGPFCGTDKCGKSPCRLFFVDGGREVPPDEDAGGAAVYGTCGLGGDPCHCVTCPPFEACDVNNAGACECGGHPAENLPGVVCAADQACVDPFDGGEPTCMRSCQPFGAPCPSAQAPDASVPQGCYYFPASQATVCAPPTGDAEAGSECQLPTDCAIPYTCESDVVDGGAGSSAAVCLPYCDVFPDGGRTSMPPPDGGSHPCVPGSICTPLPSGIVAGTCEPE